VVSQRVGWYRGFRSFDWRWSTGSAVGAAIVGLLLVVSLRVALSIVGVLVILAVLGRRRAALAFLALGFGIGAAISDSTIAPPLAAASGVVTLNPAKLGPYVLLGLGAVLSLGDGKRWIRVAPVQALLGVYFLAAGLGILGSPIPTFAAQRWIQGAVPLAAAIIVRAKYPASRLPLVLVLFGGLWNVIAATYLDLNGGGLANTFGPVSRFSGLVGPDTLAMMAAYVIAASIWIAWQGRKSFAIGAALVVGVSVYALIESSGRTGFVAILGMVCVLIGQGARSGQLGGSSRWFARLSLAAAIVIGGVLEFSSVAAWFTRGSSSDLTNLTGRLKLWHQVWPYVLQHPLFGWGPGALRGGPLAEALRSTFGNSGQAHNALLEAALSAGLIGAMIWLVAFFSLGFALLRRSEKRSDLTLRRALWVGLAIGGITLSGAAGFGFDWFLLLALTCTLDDSRAPTGVPSGSLAIERSRVN
jgi:O-antigen ligase